MPKSYLSVVCALSTGLACSRTPELETRTFELQYIEAETAAQIVRPYIYEDRPNEPGRLSIAENIISIRETEDNLDKIARVLEQFDKPAPSVQLQFQLIEADGAARSDPAIADIEAALRELFRFEGYQLVTSAVLGGVEGSHMQQPVTRGSDRYSLWAQIENVRGSGDSATVRLEVGLEPGSGRAAFATRVNVRAGKTVVLGNTRPDPSKPTLILTVKAEVSTP